VWSFPAVAPLEGYNEHQWVCFEHALVVRDLFTGGTRTFLSQADAREFRTTMYGRYGLQAPELPRPEGPRTITFQRKRANRRIVNEDVFINMLTEFGEVGWAVSLGFVALRVVTPESTDTRVAWCFQVNVVEFNGSTPFSQQLKIISDTDVFISVHTSNLANSQFLRPGSAVFEVIQRNWIWHDLDKSFQVRMCSMSIYVNQHIFLLALPHWGSLCREHLMQAHVLCQQFQTEIMGDIHHYAWRCKFRNQTVYIAARDSERFGDWSSDQCATEECVEAHTNVDVVVNVNEFRSLLADRLPYVYAGAPVDAARLPWPVK
jgi:Glycosyltransferase 61